MNNEGLRWRPNLTILVGAMCLLAGLQLAFGTPATLPLATALGGSLGTLGLALVKDDPAPAKQVTLPAETLDKLATTPNAVYGSGYNAGYSDGRRAARKEFGREGAE